MQRNPLPVFMCWTVEMQSREAIKNLTRLSIKERVSKKLKYFLKTYIDHKANIKTFLKVYSYSKRFLKTSCVTHQINNAFKGCEHFIPISC